MTDQPDAATAPHGGGRRFHRLRLVVRAIHLFMVLLILVTGVFTAGRLLTPLVFTQQAAVTRELSRLFGTEVAIGDLQGDWFRFGPIINVSELRLNTGDADASQVIGTLAIKPSLWRSLTSLSLIIDEVTIREPEFILRQDANGMWTLAGMTAGGGAADYTDAILDFLLTTGRLQIVEANLGLQWNDGRSLTLENIFINLDNTGANHVLLAQARLAGEPSPFQLQLEFSGDPRRTMSGTAYLHGNQQDLTGLFPVPGMDMAHVAMSGELWGRFTQDQFSLQAVLSEMALDGQGDDNSLLNRLALNNGNMTLALQGGRGNHWQAWLDDFGFDWQNRPWQGGGIYLDYSVDGDSKPLSVSIGAIDLGMVHDIVDDLLKIPEQGASALADLSPTGRAENLRLDTDLGGAFANGFRLRANLADVAVGAWQGAPSGAGIAGYIEADANQGTVVVDATDFTIHLPRVFDDAWHFDTTTSRVHWRIEDGLAWINSSVIDVRNAFIHGHVQFDILNRLDADGMLMTDLTLLIGVLDFDATQKSLFLPTLPKVRDTMDWLDASLLAGHVTDSGFVSRSRVSQGATPLDDTVLTWYNVEDGELKFLPDWPVLSGIEALVVVNNSNVDINASSAVIESIALAGTSAMVRPEPDGGSLLQLSGNADTTTALGLAFLRNTPVRNNIGDFIDNWQGEGSVHVDVNLGIPLGLPGRDTAVAVDVVSNGSTLTIPDYSLSVEELRGRVLYNNANGLTANALSGRLFDFPIAATIEGLRDDNDALAGTRIIGSGRASKNALQTWQGQPQFVRDVLNFAGGEIDYLAEIAIPYADASGNSNTSLRLTSELLGLSMDLPYPFAKTADQIRPLVLLIDFTDQEEWISARFDNRVSANLRIRQGEFAGGQVVLGDAARENPFGPVALSAPGLVFSGKADRYDYDAWEQAAVRFNEMAAQGGENNTLAELISDIDVHVGLLSAIGQELTDVRTQVRRASRLPGVAEESDPADPDSWLVSLENTLMKGDILFPDDVARPWLVDLDYLRFAEDEAPEDPEAEVEEVDVLGEVVPSELPAMDFHTDELAIGTKQLGAWDFMLRPNADSASISNLTMTTPDARIRDFSDQTGANLNWRYSNGKHISSFTGLFRATDLARVLPGWGYDANVESEQASFVSNLQWTGSPAAFSLEKVIGNVVVNINDGRFVDIDSGGSRLFGAFNLDSLVRRLQLDFSDLYEKGLAYDDINGRLQFNEGVVRTDGPFQIDGPSSRIRLNGELNMIRETIDADMEVNVPLGQNISVLAGILGAWPIALSTYIASKIFKDQVNDFTTILYRLEGPWENPTSGFEPSEEILEATEPVETPEQDAEAAAPAVP